MSEMNPFYKKKIAVIGAAKSGVAVACFLKRHGAEVFVSEKESSDKRPTETEKLKQEHIPCEFGGHSERINESDFVVVSPGVPMNIPVLEKIKESGIPVYSELEVATWMLNAPVIAITGTNGKTTTTTLIGEIFKQSGRHTIVAGNVGTPLSEVVDSSTPDGIAVLEVSSFQAEGFLHFAPKIGILLNLAPDHMDRYKTEEEYYQAKMRTFMNQRSDDFLIHHADNELVRQYVESVRARKIPFSSHHRLEFGAWLENGQIHCCLEGKDEIILHRRELGLRGMHNVENVLAAVLAARLMQVPEAVIAQTLRQFTGVEHRLEFVCEVRRVKFYNDSKATNVDSALVGLESFDEPVIWIAGGKHKGAPYTPLSEAVRRHVRCMVLIGEAAPLIEKDLGMLVKTIQAQSMQEAVEMAFRESQPGDVVLLSPACSSYDMFTNYEERGRVFKSCARSLMQE